MLYGIELAYQIQVIILSIITRALSTGPLYSLLCSLVCYLLPLANAVSKPVLIIGFM